MKADILRRAEAMVDDEDESEVEIGGGSVVKEKAKDVIVFAHEDELGLDVLTGVKVSGDGDESEQEGGDDVLQLPETTILDVANIRDGQTREIVQRPSPETILELAYISDPKLFERDGQTRRGKPRADLRTQTGTFNECVLPEIAHRACLVTQAGPMNRLKDGGSCWNEM
jgi:activating signal cointegrator complex subunit 2